MAEGMRIELMLALTRLPLSRRVHYHSANLPKAEDIGIEPMLDFHPGYRFRGGRITTLPIFL